MMAMTLGSCLIAQASEQIIAQPAVGFFGHAFVGVKQEDAFLFRRRRRGQTRKERIGDADFDGAASGAAIGLDVKVIVLDNVAPGHVHIAHRHLRASQIRLRAADADLRSASLGRRRTSKAGY